MMLSLWGITPYSKARWGARILQDVVLDIARDQQNLASDRIFQLIDGSPTFGSARGPNADFLQSQSGQMRHGNAVVSIRRSEGAHRCDRRVVGLALNGLQTDCKPI